MDAESNSPGWLMPCEALTRFQPEIDYKFYQQDAQAHQDIRYGYRVGSKYFVVCDGVTSEVLDSSTIFPLPLADPLITGLVNLRGNLIPVCDLHDETPRYTSMPYSHRILVLKSKEGEIGIKIEDFPKPIHGTISKHNAVQMDDSAWSDYVLSVLSAQGKKWYELNCHAFMKHRATQAHAEN